MLFWALAPLDALEELPCRWRDGWILHFRKCSKCSDKISVGCCMHPEETPLGSDGLAHNRFHKYMWMKECHMAIKHQNQNSSPAMSPTMHHSVLSGAQGLEQLRCRATGSTELPRWPVYHGCCVDRPTCIRISSLERWVRPRHLTVISLMPSPHGLIPEATNSLWAAVLACGASWHALKLALLF